MLASEQMVRMRLQLVHQDSNSNNLWQDCQMLAPGQIDEEVKFQVQDVLRYYFSVNDEVSIIPSR